MESPRPARESGASSRPEINRRLLRAVGAALVLGGALLVVGYTLATLNEIRLIEAEFGVLATGAGRRAMLPRLLLVDGLGLVAIVVGVVLLLRARSSGEEGDTAADLRPAGPVPEIRDVRPEEVDAASEVVVSAYRELLGDKLGHEYAAVLADVADRAANATVLVAVERGRVIGCVTYVDGQGPYAEFTEEDAAGIRMLAVAPGEEGRGIGAALVRACLERARAAGRRRVVLHSQEEMAAAQRLYLREGFVRAPDRDWEVHPGLLLLGYELTL